MKIPRNRILNKQPCLGKIIFDWNRIVDMRYLLDKISLVVFTKRGLVPVPEGERR